MSTKYWDYIQEREGLSVIETESGFAIFRLDTPEIIYLQDLYVVPEKRNTGEAKALLERVCDIGREVGAKQIVTTVCPRANNSTHSMKKILSQNFNLSHANSDLVFFIKDL